MLIEFTTLFIIHLNFFTSRTWTCLEKGQPETVPGDWLPNSVFTWDRLARTRKQGKQPGNSLQSMRNEKYGLLTTQSTWCKLMSSVWFFLVASKCCNCPTNNTTYADWSLISLNSPNFPGKTSRICIKTTSLHINVKKHIAKLHI